MYQNIGWDVNGMEDAKLTFIMTFTKLWGLHGITRDCPEFS